MSEEKKRRRVPRELLWIGAAAAVVLGVFVAVWLSHRPRPPGETGKLVFEDDFERAELGANYLQGEPDKGWSKGTWQVKNGRLYGKGIHNAQAWLQVPLPDQVRIEFDARAESPDGDLKVEVFGDGRTHQSGYILIHGGWKNSTSIIARQDEHGEDRKEEKRLLPRAGGGRRVAVERGVDYRWVIERTDGTLRWYLNGSLFLTYPDNDPVRGKHFAFGNWDPETSFDNLKIYDLGQ